MARSTEVALDRASLILVTASLESDALEAVGRREEALGWYHSMAERSPYELIYAKAAGERTAALADAATPVAGLASPKRQA
jgi:hypothetical protein